MIRTFIVKRGALWLVLLSLITSMSAKANTPRAMEWRGVPLQVVLTPGQETIVSLSSDVRVAQPWHLASSLSVTSLAGRIYLTATEPFDPTRLQVMRLSDGTRLMLDVSAQTGITTPAMIDIVLPDDASRSPTSVASAPAALKMAPQALLVRYAMQTLYSPSHAIEPLPGVVRAPMGLPVDISLSAFSQWRVSAKPIAAWQLGEQVVTAVSLTNQSPRRETLDPRQVTLSPRCFTARCAVSFSHPEIEGAGTPSAQATAFIVTPGPLAGLLLPSRGGEQ
ncbi:TIGR03749 family integrating conjugative element protein [uncultured Vibrio sp.]|uniref:TIGR03749 family integrating conjugative element protein n=1 Tax=uncultured Vibrio sp. TaxID=114054 RepID=UPI00261C1F32|nr:TIGR03749 family integrating conjugative element protein [uncultured Vibrio sp.]